MIEAARRYLAELRQEAGLDIRSAEDGRSLLRDAVFNGEVELPPLPVVLCRSVQDVREAVRLAASHRQPLSVLAGGHDLAGRGFRDGHVILDVRRLSGVRVDEAASEVTVDGGALTRDLLDALPEDMATVTGTVKSVGVTGLTLGGGYGRLTNRCGLALDCLKRAQVVLADGSLVTASERQDAELFWALRGGGSGFGVVTAMTLAAFRITRVLSAMIVFPLASAKRAMLRYQQMLDAAPDGFSVFAGFITAPTGDRVLFVAPLWIGEEATGERFVQELAHLDGAQVLHRGWSAYRDTFDDEAEKAWPKGRHYRMETQTIGCLDETAAEMLLEGARTMPTPNSAIVLHDFCGAPSRVPADATAFPLRRDHFVVEIIAAWDREPDGDGARHKAWARSLSETLATVAFPGGYVSLLDPEDGERAQLFYGNAAQRLARIKKHVDPHDIFRAGTGRLNG